MIKLLFRPAMIIMYRLSYPLKFALVSALFAVPLSITSVQTILDWKSEIDSAEYKQIGLEKINAFHPIILELEQLRDLSISQRINDNKEINSYYEKSLTKSKLVLNEFIQSKKFTHKTSFLLSAQDLQLSLNEFQPSTGSEGDLVYSIFDSVNFLVDNAYTLQSEIANEHGLLSDSSILEAQLTSILVNDFQGPMESMGRARAYGTYFINATLIGSQGILLLEQTYLTLNNLEKRLRQSFKILFDTYSEPLNHNNINSDSLNNISEIGYLLEENLLLDPDLSTPWLSYYQSTSQAINKINGLQQQVIDFLSKQYQQRYSKLKHDRKLYILSLGTLIGLFIYLFIGFYLTVRNSIEGLSQAAMHVANGALDEHFNTQSYDEMGKLAKVLDVMRSQLKERHQQLVEQAITDGLTGINNRKHFNDKLTELITLSRRYKKPLTLLIIDIDHFKKLNDHYGHQAGDYCLQAVAQYLEKSLTRETDEVYRYGGEEFTILLPDSNLSGGNKVAQQLCDGIRNLPLTYNSQELKVTISTGLACTEHIDDYNDDNLVSLADDALYKAKELGRDRVVSAHDFS